MQTIKHNYTNLHRVFDQIERFYAYASQKTHNELVPTTFDDCLQQLASIFLEYGGVAIPKFKPNAYKKLDVPSSGNNVIVCFSGGKDSIAVAMKYKQMGCNVYLYHTQHINPSFSDEVTCARQVAETLDLPLFVDDIRLVGHHEWMEHPMKNMIIADGALHYGITSGIGTRIVFGNYRTSVLDDNPFDRCAGDCVDMWEVYDNIIGTVIDGYQTEFGLENMTETLEIITPNRELLDQSLSCLCRHSLRPYRHKWVLDKFGVNLPQHRCGSCYKCCVEYIYMADHNLIEFSKDYYKYCLTQLRKVLRNEEVDAYSIYDVWDSYLFYPIYESKIIGDLSVAQVTPGGIKWWKTTKSITNVCN